MQPLQCLASWNNESIFIAEKISLYKNRIMGRRKKNNKKILNKIIKNNANFVEGLLL
jgi:hypothetical protein